MNSQPVTEGALLWSPTPAVIRNANLTHYMQWLHATYGLTFSTYRELWQWSVTELEAFWASWWAYMGVASSQPYTKVLAERSMPGAQWFVGAQLNYAENIFARRTDQRPALLYQSETEPLTEISWQTLYTQTTKLAHALRALGVQRGDRVVANRPTFRKRLLACWRQQALARSGQAVRLTLVVAACLTVSVRLSQRC